MASKQAIPGAKRSNMFKVDPATPLIIGLDTEHKSKAEHELYDERIKLPVTQAEIENVKMIGIKQNVILRKEEMDGEEVFVVVAGRQRIRMARAANAQLLKAGEPTIEVPATVERGSDELMSVINVATNSVRKDDDILSKARIAEDMLASDRYDMTKVAAAFGVSKTAVKQWLSLLKAPKEVRAAAQAGTISQSAAVKLAGLKADDAKEALADMKKNGAKTAKAAQSAAQKKKAKAKGKPDVEVSTHPSLPKRKIQKIVIASARLQADEGAATETVEEGLAKLVDEKDASYLDLFLLGMRVACGDRSTGSVKGLNDLIEECLG